MIEGWANVDRLAVVDCETSGKNKRRLLVLRYTGKFNGERYEWSFSAEYHNENTLGMAIQQGVTCINAEVVNGIAKASPLSFDRFSKGKIKPFVAITRLVGSKDKLLGYKVIDINGRVMNLKLSKMIEMALKLEPSGNGCLVQNLVFMGANNGKKPYFKEMNDSIPVEKMVSDVTRKHAVTDNTVNKSTEQISKEAEAAEKAAKEPKASAKSQQAKKQFTREQAKALFEGEKKGLDVSLLKNPEINAACMRAYILDMENGLDITYYLDPKFDLGQLMEISLAYEEGLDFTPLVDPSIKAEEMSEMRVRMEESIFIDYNKVFNVEGQNKQ